VLCVCVHVGIHRYIQCVCCRGAPYARVCMYIMYVYTHMYGMCICGVRDGVCVCAQDAGMNKLGLTRTDPVARLSVFASVPIT